MISGCISAVRDISKSMREVWFGGLYQFADGADGARDFFAALNHNHQLEAVRLSEADIGNDGLYAIGSILSDQNSILSELSLCNGSGNDDAITSLYSGLLKSSSLKKLVIESNSWPGDKHITVRGWQLLSDVIASPHSALEHLAITNCCINEASTTTLLSGLAANSTLQHLDLSHNEITHDNATALASGLAGNETMVKLILEGCWIDDRSATAISSGLEQNTSLQVLDLTNLKNITKIGWSKLMFSPP